MSQQTPYQLGIDLGTTYTAAAVARHGTAHPVQLTPDSHSMPSVVALREDGTMLAGEAAARRALIEPTRVGREFKRRFGDAAPIVLGGTRTSAEALTTELLKETLHRVSQVEGAAPTRVTLTHPAAWGPFRLDKLRAVAADAGVANLELLPEPVAAALANTGKVAAGSLVVVYDLGGGTFDAAVVRIGDNVIIGNPEGVERLGGVDIDALVLSHVDDATGGMISEADIGEQEVRAGLARLVDDCRVAKEALSADAETEVAVNLPTVRTSVRITRAELESMVRPRLDDSLAALDRAVASAGVGWADIASVLLVGGSSRVPLVTQVVREHTGRPVVTATNPHLAVALGAALHAAACEQATVTSPSTSATSSPTSSPTSPAAAAQPATTTRSRRGLILGAAAAVVALVVGGILLLGGDDTDDNSTTASSTQPSPASNSSVPVSAVSSTSPPAGGHVEVPVGDATISADECVDTTGQVARATAIDIDGTTLAAIIDGNLYVLIIEGDCVVSSATDEVNGLVRDGDTDFSTVAIVDNLLIVGSPAGGLIVNRDTGSGADCGLLREIVNGTPAGTVATYDSGGQGYDELTVTADGCQMMQAGKLADYSFYATAAGPNAVFIGAKGTEGAIGVHAFRGTKELWSYAEGPFESIDGLATCGGFLCVLDATAERLTVLIPATGQVVGSVTTGELASGTPQRLNAAGDGYLTVGEPGSSLVLLKLGAS